MRTNQSLLGSAVILEPATQNDNVVQPLVDSVSAIILRPHSPSQSAPLIGFQAFNGGAISSVVDASGNVSGGSLANAVILAPSTAGRNTIQPTADNVQGLIINRHSATQSVPSLQVGGAIPNSEVSIVAGDDNNDGLVVQARSTGTPGNGDSPFRINDRFGNSFFDTADTGSGGAVVVINTTNNGDNALLVRGNGPGQTGDILIVYGSPTIVFSVSKNGVGFFGTASTTQQAGASAAGIGSVTDANAKAALTALQNALHAYGLVTAPA